MAGNKSNAMEEAIPDHYCGGFGLLLCLVQTDEFFILITAMSAFFYLMIIPIPFIPLVFYLVDAKKEKNLKRGIYQILAFLAFSIMAIAFLFFFKMVWVCSVPLLFILYIGLIIIKNNPKC